MSTVQCPATVQTSVSGAVECVDGTGAAVAWIVVPAFDPADIPEGELAGYFGAGFGLVTVCISIGIGIKAILDVIEKG